MLTDLPCNRNCQGVVSLGIDLGDVGLGVAENDLSGFKSELPPNSTAQE